jgi:hypothetical protein
MGLLLRLPARERHAYNAKSRDQVARRISVQRAFQRRFSRPHLAVFTCRSNEQLRLFDRYPESRLDVPPLSDVDDRRTAFSAAINARRLHGLSGGTELVHDVVFGDLLCACTRRQRQNRGEECRWRDPHQPVDPFPRHSPHRVLRTRGPHRGPENPATRPWRRSPPRLAGLPRRRLPALPSGWFDGSAQAAAVPQV